MSDLEKMQALFKELEISADLEDWSGRPGISVGHTIFYFNKQGRYESLEADNGMTYTEARGE